MRLSRLFKLQCCACFVAALIGCTGNPEFKQPSASDSTEDLTAVLAEKPSKHPAIQAVRKTKAVEILATRGDAALPGLFQVALDENEQHTVRFVAEDAIGNLPTVPAERLPALMKLRRGGDGIMFNKVLERSSKSAPTQAVPLLVEFVTDEKIKYEDRQFVGIILLKVDEQAAASAGVVKNAGDTGHNIQFMPDIKPAQK